MKEYLKELVATTPGALPGTRVVREYLQARMLQALQEGGAFTRWAFLGGTALRFLYGLPRYSEDLGFSAVDQGSAPGVGAVLRRIESMLGAEGYALSLKVNDQKTVAAALVRFPGLLYELGLSPRSAQVLSIKIEVDTNPPPGAVTQTSLVRRHVTLNLLHHDQASLLAGKLHAILSRDWTKGRDLYDLIWYLADRTWPAPNLELLNAALTQTRWRGPEVTPRNWREVLAQKLDSTDWPQARADVLPFLERDREVDLMNRDSVLGLLRARGRD